MLSFQPAESRLESSLDMTRPGQNTMPGQPRHFIVIGRNLRQWRQAMGNTTVEEEKAKEEPPRVRKGMKPSAAGDIFTCIFSNKKSFILIHISLTFVPEVPIDRRSTLVKVMVWCPPGDKPLPDPVKTEFYDAISFYLKKYDWAEVQKYRSLQQVWM